LIVCTVKVEFDLICPKRCLFKIKIKGMAIQRFRGEEKQKEKRMRRRRRRIE
jgi:hypothetical protein